MNREVVLIFSRGGVQTVLDQVEIRTAELEPIQGLLKMFASCPAPGYPVLCFLCMDFLSWCHREYFLVCDFQANNDILAFLSGMPVTRNTKYLDLKNAVSHWTVILQTHMLLYVACFLFSK